MKPMDRLELLELHINELKKSQFAHPQHIDSLEKELDENTEIAKLKAEKESYYHDYRVKHDIETKGLRVEIEKLIELLDSLIKYPNHQPKHLYDKIQLAIKEYQERGGKK